MPSAPRNPRARLAALYDTLPTMQCKGLCAPVACTSVGMTALEQQNIRAATGVALPRMGAFAADGELCPALDSEHRCRVYEHRPTTCRLWGMVPSMRCPHGCEPVMTEHEGATAMRATLNLSEPRPGRAARR